MQIQNSHLSYYTTRGKDWDRETGHIPEKY